MTKLRDLTAQESADLLGVPLEGASRWLEEARFLKEGGAQGPLGEWEAWLRDAEPVPYLRHAAVKDLMALSVEDVRRLKGAGRFLRRCPYFGREQPVTPEDRLRRLRDLLAEEAEFEARYPAAFAVLSPRFDAGRGLPLPSFGARVARSVPQRSVVPAGWSQDRTLSQDSGDVFSATPAAKAAHDGGPEGVDRGFAPVDPGYLRGVLLAILGREEFAERVAPENRSEASRVRLGASARSAVRLRLTSASPPPRRCGTCGR